MAVVLRNSIVLAHLMAKLGERGCPVKSMTRGHGLGAGTHDALDRPLHTGMLGSGGRFAAVRVRGAVIEHLIGVKAPLVGSALVLDHGGLTAEATHHHVSTQDTQRQNVSRRENKVRRAYLFKQPS